MRWITVTPAQTTAPGVRRPHELMPLKDAEPMTRAAQLLRDRMRAQGERVKKEQGEAAYRDWYHAESERRMLATTATNRGQETDSEEAQTGIQCDPGESVLACRTRDDSERPGKNEMKHAAKPLCEQQVGE